MSIKLEADIAIIGGGIAGLWLLHALHRQGFAAILIEGYDLAQGQTIQSQGIIHGGFKYALHGQLTTAASTMATMPDRWRTCLSGQGDIDLTQARILSSAQYLWSPHKLVGKITGFFTALALQGKLESLKIKDSPPIFANHPFKGQVFRLNEVVLDVPSIIAALSKTYQQAILKVDPLTATALQWNPQGQLQSISLHLNQANVGELTAKRYIFTAGEGNEQLLSPAITKDWVKMQRRPLQMIAVKIPYPDAHLYGHCLGASRLPRITITTHITRAGETVWYLGGQIAEEGVARQPAQQIAAAQQELTALFPWWDFEGLAWKTLIINRAEVSQANGSRPDSCWFKAIHNVLIAWPTKLAFAPRLSDDINAHLIATGIKPEGQMQKFSDLTSRWPKPAIAKPIWEW